MRPNPPQHRGSAPARGSQHTRRAFRPLLEQLETRVVPSTTISYGFGNPSGLTANGSAVFTGSVARLTSGAQNQAGSFFYTNAKLDITQFTTQFTFVDTNVTNPSGGGLTFTIQNAGPNALGSPADGLGYAGIGSSVAIKFDLFNNAANVPSSSTGIYTGGASPTVPSIDLSASGIDFHSQHQFLVTLKYDGSTLTETIHDNVNGATFAHGYSVSIPSAVGNNTTAFVGFTGGSGGFTAIQDIQSWQGTFGPQTGLTISSLSPNTATEGSGSFALTVNGSGFVSGATVTWTENGTTTTLTPFSVSSSQLRVVVPASLLTPGHGGLVSVTVVELIGRILMTSNAATFTITPLPTPGLPTISSLNPNSVVEGSGSFTLTVFGSGFVPGATVQWSRNGTTTLTPFSASSNQLQVVVPASLVTEESNTVHGVPTITVVETVNGVTVSSNPMNFTITEAPIFATGGFTISGTVGQGLTTTVATFTDSGGPENPFDPGDYSASINWGNGSGSSSGTISLSGNVFTVTGSHTYAAGGTFTVTVTIIHETVSATATDTATISPFPTPTLTITSFSPGSVQEGSAGFTLTVFGSGFVPGATVQWSRNGTTNLVTTFDSSSQLQAIVPASLLTEESNSAHGVPAITVVQTVNGVTRSSNAVNFTITEAPIFVTGGFTISGTAGQSFTTTVATFTNSGGPENPFDPSDYSASIDWGNGSGSSSGTISLSGNVFTVTGSHTYGSGGTFTVTVTITHETVSGTATDTATISPFPITGNPIITSLSPNSVQEGSGSFTLFVFGSNFVPGATVQWSRDGTTNLATTFDNSSKLQAVVPSSLLVEESNSIHGVPAITVVETINGFTQTSNTVTFTITEAPIFATGGFNISGTAGQALTTTVATFIDSGGPQNPNDPGDYSASINWGNGSGSSSGTISLSGNVFTVTGSHTYGSGGTFTVTVTITHETVSATATDTATIGPTGPPTIISLSPNSVQEGSGTFTLFVFGSNFVPGATVQWSRNGTTTLATTFDSSSKLQAVVPASLLVEESNSIHGVPTITVVETNGTSNTVNFTITEAPIVPTGGFNISGVEGQSFTATVATFVDTGGPQDPNDPGDYNATINWGDSTTSSGTISLSGNVFTVTGSHTYGGMGTFTISVTINHESASPVTVTDTASVTDAVLSATGVTVNALQGMMFTGMVAWFTDGNSKPKMSDFSATIAWGNGNTSTASISQNTNGRFIVSGSNMYLAAGSFPITVAIKDAGGSKATAKSMATVADAPLTATGLAINATQGTTFTGVVARFTDADTHPNLNDFSATITWGDGNSSTGIITKNADASFSVSGSNRYQAPGTFPITVTINDAGGSKAAAKSTATVADAPLTASGLTINASQGSTFTGVVATFTDADSKPNLNDLSATIAWGDGNSSMGTITQNADGSFSVSGSNTYQALGTFAITVVISDVGGSKATATSTATVADAPLTATGLAISASQGNTFTGAVATFTDADSNPNLNDFSATIAWGDGNSSMGTITQNADGSFSVSGSNTYQAAGTYTITVTINDAGGSTATATSTVNVVLADLPLAGTGMDITATQFLGQDQTVAQFSDPDPNAQVGDYTALIDWGDGTQVDTGTVTQPGGPGTPFFVDFTHAYNDVGPFTIHVNITDNGGASDGGGAFIDLYSTATVISPSARHAAGRGSSGPGQGTILPVDAVLLGGVQGSIGQRLQGGAIMASSSATSAVPLAQASASVKSGQPSPGADSYWQILSRLRGDRITDPNGWAADELALALQGTAR